MIKKQKFDTGENNVLVWAKDVRILRRELYWKDFLGKDKYDKFKDWVIENHSDVWMIRGVFDAFEKKYDNNGDVE